MALCKECLALAQTTPKHNPWENANLRITDGENCDRCDKVMYNEEEIKPQALPQITSTKDMLILIALVFLAGLCMGILISNFGGLR
jgi:hypothetical protein